MRQLRPLAGWPKRHKKEYLNQKSYNMLILLLKSLWFFLPIGVANMAPVLVKNWFPFLGRPIDGGRRLGGQPLFGSHKTWRGLLAAVVCGEIIFLLQRYLVLRFPDSFASLTFTDYAKLSLWSGALMGGGAILGDLIKSFFKRRVGKTSGSRWIPFDQIDYIIGGLAAASIITRVPGEVWATLLITGFLLHILTNHIGFWLGMREDKF
ncbi:MAG: hypothetical protein A3F54_01125 [Candidatus Kerfeldbacteria bacterium RIFCSPHIGHO2_12_FULL_48_17]|uniref:CDP-2,3-bis-(O-geranylgeranyl)-sn-glycerol synthase n=1 Tax=Candidatus Kerfeldbacteria bacterium RIFCSPHIGHO2_12_FULL_48_17 TaxID=1798542 RepID=A0A1G2AYW1_9BACT|nr:MAG: hypothetical protein A3F54_01125 [Candidatus Kerfeldbacteria bacterium RIFCSPHIGHO2_12_FULL_48_17]